MQAKCELSMPNNKEAATLKCKVCGKKIEKSRYTNGVLCSAECFVTDYWNERVALRDTADSVRINGIQYFIDKENSKSSFRGFGGRKFIIEFFDGRVVTTTNLWHNGEIPDTHKSLLPDNARFIEE